MNHQARIALAWLTMLAAGCGARDVGLFAEGDGAGGSAQGAGGGGASGTGTGVNGTGTGVNGTGATSGVGAGAGTGTGTGATSGVGAGSGTGTGTGVTSGVGTSTGSGTGAGSTGSGGKVCPSFGDACTDCLSIDCPELYCACVDNKECVAFIQCTNACGGGEACDQACMSKHEAGIADAILLSGCGGEACAGPCPGAAPIDPCSACIFENCEDEGNACLAEPACLTLYNCLTGCPNLGLMCQQQCYADYSAGVPLLEDMLTCAESPCNDACD